MFTTGVTKVLYKTENIDGDAEYCEFYVIVISLGLSIQFSQPETAVKKQVQFRFIADN